MTPQFLRSASDGHLLAALHAEACSLTTTDTELALAERLERTLDDCGPLIEIYEEIEADNVELLNGAGDALNEVLTFCRENEVTVAQLAELLKALPEASSEHSLQETIKLIGPLWNAAVEYELTDAEKLIERIDGAQRAADHLVEARANLADALQALPEPEAATA